MQNDLNYVHNNIFEIKKIFLKAWGQQREETVGSVRGLLLTNIGGALSFRCRMGGVVMA